MNNVKRSYEEIREKISLSIRQINYMKHAVGLDRPTKKQVFIAYRNYVSYGKDDVDWDYLVFWGVARKLDTGYYKLTDYGFQLLSDILGIKVIDDE